MRKALDDLHDRYIRETVEFLEANRSRRELQADGYSEHPTAPSSVETTTRSSLGSIRFLAILACILVPPIIIWLAC